jgi:adenosylhomocysteine nucleosidase
MRNYLVLAALESEFFSTGGLIKKIHYTGIGKINSAHMTTQLILEEKPDLILNVGTAGCLKSTHLGKVFGVREVIERDMIAEPLAPRGTVPLSNQKPILESSFGTARCATGDSFVTEADSWLIENRVDLVDMELFAIAKIAIHYGVEWRSIKYASDLADETAARDWSNSLKNVNLEIMGSIEEAIDG